MEDAVVGVVGQGFVGSAMRHYFESRDTLVLSYDKFKPTGLSLPAVVRKADVIFVCVPTPMRKSGECYTNIVESVLTEIVLTAREVNRSLRSFVVCIKATVPPGFTDRMRMRTGLRLVFSPEFLREKSANEDMLNATRVIVGGPHEDAEAVLSLFAGSPAKLVHTEAAEAEMSKLMVNGLLFTKVTFANEIALLCETMGIEYDAVRKLTALDPRVGESHMNVPGHDGQRGAGGHCFPKDMNNLAHLSRTFGTQEHLFTAVLDRNDEIREDRDWEQMQGRAVIAR